MAVSLVPSLLSFDRACLSEELGLIWRLGRMGETIATEPWLFSKLLLEFYQE